MAQGIRQKGGASGIPLENLSREEEIEVPPEAQDEGDGAIDEELQLALSMSLMQSTGHGYDPEQMPTQTMEATLDDGIAALCALGFDAGCAAAALFETQGNVDEAALLLCA